VQQRPVARPQAPTPQQGAQDDLDIPPFLRYRQR
jgi:hypothetical protein